MERYWMLDTGCWILDPGSLMLVEDPVLSGDAECSIVDFCSRLKLVTQCLLLAFVPSLYRFDKQVELFPQDFELFMNIIIQVLVC